MNAKLLSSQKARAFDQVQLKLQRCQQLSGTHRSWFRTHYSPECVAHDVQTLWPCPSDASSGHNHLDTSHLNLDSTESEFALVKPPTQCQALPVTR